MVFFSDRLLVLAESKLDRDGEIALVYGGLENVQRDGRVSSRMCTSIPALDWSTFTSKLTLLALSRSFLRVCLWLQAGGDGAMVRVHSSCYTGDVLGSHRCDCGEQLQTSMQAVARHGCGVVIYLHQEGRGIGLMEKLKAYNLQVSSHAPVVAWDS